MKYFFLSITLFFILSCKTSIAKQNKDEICKIIIKLNKNDQKYRGNKLAIDPFFEILDSIKKSEGISNDIYKNFTEEKQLSYGRKARNIANKRKKVNPKIIDSLMVLQEKLDNENTEILIHLIKNNGYPNIDSLPCKQTPDLVFLHAQPQYFKEIKKLITKEYKKGHLNKFQYAMWLRHIGGRKENNLEKIIEDNEIIITE